MATTTLRPAGAGNSTQLTATGAGTNHGCVNESSSDGDTTYVVTSIGNGTQTDLYTIKEDANSIGVSDTINSITVYLIARATATGRLIIANRVITIRENSVTTYDASVALTTSYATYSKTWNTKPSNGTSWTKTDIDNLEIGVRLVINNNGGSAAARCTQVYVIVDYTPSGGGGSVSQKIIMPRQAIKRASNY